MRIRAISVKNVDLNFPDSIFPGEERESLGGEEEEITMDAVSLVIML